MEDTESSGGTFDGGYNKLIGPEDFGVDEHPLYSRQEKPQVSMSMVRPEAILNHYKQLTVSLAVLAVLLLTVDIGLGVYYGKLTDGDRTVMDISGEVSRLQASYNTAIQRRDEAKKQLAQAISEQQLTKWELEHEKRRTKDYEKQTDRVRMEIAGLQSHMPMLREGCRHCLPGWTYMNSQCYYFAVSETTSPRSWQEARQFCTRRGGDLAIIDSREKHLAILELLRNYRDNGFWIGLRDVEEEGIWKWLDGTRLSEGFWNDGEPNNSGNEDCAAAHTRPNPFKSWNDAPCSADLKWICEMAPRLTS